MTSLLFRCELCKYTSNKKYNLLRHQNAKHNIKNDQNNNTEEKHIQNEEIVINDTEDVFYCKKCNKKYKTNNYLTIHEKNCTGLSIFTCPKCKKTFSNTSNKSKHIKNNKCKELIINNTEKKNETNLFIFIHSKTMFQIIC
jgi:uncharacterized protein YbaR (Trm112 family)